MKVVVVAGVCVFASMMRRLFVFLSLSFLLFFRSCCRRSKAHMLRLPPMKKGKMSDENVLAGCKTRDKARFAETSWRGGVG